MNRLFYGDCLTILRDKIPKESVDLIYLDPPFNSNREYNNIYKDETGRPLPDQVEAFNDTWTLDEERNRCIRQMPVLLRDAGLDDEVAQFWKLWMNALRRTNPKLLAYLSYMVERLLYLWGVLKPTGSIYLHCDSTASHYLKIFMDGIFGHNNFCNEIVWSYRRWPSKSKKYQTMHDCLLFYSKSPGKQTFNVGYEPVSSSYQKRFKGKTQVLDPVRKTRKLVVDEPTKGMPLRDVWDLSILAGSSKERLGYKTQKPLPLLERIIATSSNEGELVLDPFCGCATTLEAAHKLGRKWIGIDIAIHAIKRVARVRLNDRLRLVEGADFEIDGVPRTVEGAQDLWERDKYHFQKWAVEEVDGFVTTKRTADGGIDGRLYFNVIGEQEFQSMILEVKGGTHVNINVLRELKGVLDTDDAVMAGLIVLHPLSDNKIRNFKRYMGEVGDVLLNDVQFSRLQILTVEQILNGERFNTPWVFGKTGQTHLNLQNEL